jgi:hypothetical protein
MIYDLAYRRFYFSPTELITYLHNGGILFFVLEPAIISSSVNLLLEFVDRPFY